MTRFEKLLGSCTKSDNILEIGPCQAPVAPKRDGWKTKVVDHATRDELIEKYSVVSPGMIDNSAIEEVDFLWQGGSLSDAIPSEYHGSFDALIASHVFEHLPDPIRFFMACEKLLKSDGEIILAIPDYRFIFDYFRSWTTTGDLLSAYLTKRTRHSPAECFDNSAYYVMADGNGSWGQHPIGRLTFLTDLQHAYREAQKAAQPGSYIDVHAWQMTPSRFTLAILELSELGLMNWHIETMHPTAGNEFIVVLRRGPEDMSSPNVLAQRRMRLLFDGLREQAEQAKFAGVWPEAAGSLASGLAAGQGGAEDRDLVQAVSRLVALSQLHHQEILDTLRRGSIRGRLDRLRGALKRMVS
jgi:predicted SAM-dependent methyltransferase